MELPNLAEISANSIQAAYTTWMAENTPEKIQEKCLKTLDKSAGDILRALLGFEKDSWGSHSWKVDHCNGRSGESAAGDYIRQHQQAAVDAWLAQVKMPVMTKSMQEDVQKSAMEQFKRRFRERFDMLVANYANEQADAFFKTIIESQAAQVADQMKLLKLISQQN